MQTIWKHLANGWASASVDLMKLLSPRIRIMSLALSLMTSSLFANPNNYPVPFEDGDLFGYQGASGKVVIRPQYVVAGNFNEHGVAVVMNEKGVCALIDKNGKVKLEIFNYDNGPDYFEEGLARFVEKGKMGFFDESGKKVIPAKYDFAFPFEGGYAAVCNGCKEVSSDDDEHTMIKGGKWFVISRVGKRVTTVEFDSQPSVENDKASGKINGVATTVPLK